MVDVKKPRSSTQMTKQEHDGIIHSYTSDEKAAFVGLINFHLRNDEDLKEIIPIDADNDDFFSAFGTGVLFCKMINKAVPGTIDERAINLGKKKPLNIYQIKENLTLAINSAKSIGCVMVSITAPLIIDKKEHTILGFTWQVLRIQMMQSINLKNHPYIIRLKEDDEELADILKLAPEDLLIRWFNYHLKNAGHDRRVANFGKDVQDAINYTVLLNQLDSKCDKSALDSNEKDRATKVISDAESVGVPKFMRPGDITKANSRLNLIFCAELFNNCPGLVPTEEEKYAAAGLIDDDVEGSREERSFRMWVNSLGVDGVYVNNLYEDIKDGLIVLKVLDRVQPGCVDWKKVEQKVNNKFKKVSNCNLAVQIGKDMKFSLVGIGGTDLVDGHKTYTLSYMWQLVRKHTLNMIGGKEESELLKWAQQRVHKEPTIESFKDKSISNCKFLFNLLASIEPRAINWDLVTEGDTDENVMQNCKYVLSVARKLGATIFLVWDDVKEVKPKMIMTFIAALCEVADHSGDKKHEEMPELTMEKNDDIQKDESTVTKVEETTEQVSEQTEQKAEEQN